MAQYSSIQWTDAIGGSGSTRIEGVISAAALATLAGQVEAYSNARWQGYRMYTANGTPGTAVDAQWAGCVDQAVLTFRDSNNDIVKLTILAPKLTVVDTDSGNYSVLATVGNDMATKLGTATAKVLTFLKGSIKSRKKQT